MVTGLLGNESSDSNRFTLVTPKSENDVRLQATLGNQNPTGLPVGVVSGETCHKGFGFGKNLFDGISIVISLIIGFVFTGGILGIGLGTVISMIFTGRVIALLETSISRLYSSVTEVQYE